MHCTCNRNDHFLEWIMSPPGVTGVWTAQVPATPSSPPVHRWGPGFALDVPPLFLVEAMFFHVITGHPWSKCSQVQNHSKVALPLGL